MALIGQPSPDDIWELTTDLLERVARLKRENKELRQSADYYQRRLAAERRRKATA